MPQPVPAQSRPWRSSCSRRCSQIRLRTAGVLTNTSCNAHAPATTPRPLEDTRGGRARHPAVCVVVQPSAPDGTLGLYPARRSGGKPLPPAHRAARPRSMTFNPTTLLKTRDGSGRFCEHRAELGTGQARTERPGCRTVGSG